MKHLMALTLLSLICAPAFSAAVTYSSNAKDGHVTFEAVGKPAMIKIKGESPPPKTTLTILETKTTFESVLDLDQLKTGIDLRDEHMKEKYLETKKFPQAKLVIDALSLPSDWDQKPTALKGQSFKGTLSLHGKDAPVEGTFTLDEKRKADAEFKIKLTDHGIEIPDYMGIKVAETVNVKVQVQFEKK